MHLSAPFLSAIYSPDLITPVALSIVQARFIGLVHFCVGFILTYLSFILGYSSWIPSITRYSNDRTKNSSFLYGRCSTHRYFQAIGNWNDLETYQPISNIKDPVATNQQLALIFLWLAGIFFHISWSGNSELFISNPFNSLSISHSVVDPHYASLIALSSYGIEYWLYTVRFTSTIQIYRLSISLIIASQIVESTDKKLQILSLHKLSIRTLPLLGYLSILWSAHLFFHNPPQLILPQFTFYASLNPITRSLYITDIAHHHLAVGVIFIFLGHTSFPHLRIWVITSFSQHLHLALVNALLANITSLFSQHAYSFISLSYLSHNSLATSMLYIHHQYIAGFLTTGSFIHAAIYLLRDYTSLNTSSTSFLPHKAAIISHLSYVCLFLGFHTTGLYFHNDTLVAFSIQEKQILIEPIFTQLIQTAIRLTLSTLTTLFPVGVGDLLVHHAIALGLHVTALILLKGALDARGSSLMPDKLSFGYGFACDGPGRSGTCDISAWDSFYLVLFWVHNTIAWTTFYFHWKQLTLQQLVLFQFDESSIYLNGWFRDYLWFNSASLISGYDTFGATNLSIWAWAFLLAHLCWAVGFMFLISWRGYWQELIDVIIYMHLKAPFLNAIYSPDLITPVALSIVQARFIGLVHFCVGFILTYLSFILGYSS